MSEYVLGLDLGPNSIGWAMLAFDSQTGEITGFQDTSHVNHPPLGVRVFEAGLDNFDTAKEKSLNQARRTARAMRRNHARRNARRRQLRELLVSAGLLPSDRSALDEVCRLDPYALRARGLVEDLSPHELGRALIHLAQRRGFKSNRKSGKAKEDEGILEEIGRLEEEIKKSGCSTLGHYLHHLTAGIQDPFRPRTRGMHTRRDMYAAEFSALIGRQRRIHAGVLTDDLIAAIERTIFFQHPFELTDDRRAKSPSRANLHRAPSVRPCPLEAGEMCGPKGDWYAQQFRILKEVANLRVSERHGNDRDLTADERAQLIEYLSGRDRAKFDDLRKLLAKSGVDPEARFNLERGNRASLLGNSVEQRLSAAFGRSAWAKVGEDDRGRLRELLVHADEEKQLADALAPFELADDKRSKLLKWTPADGYLGYSLKAVRRLLPLMIEGLDEYAAIQKAYPDRPEAVKVDRLPPLSAPNLPPDLSNLTNPIVRRALVELRKVMNAIIREHGMPTRIVVELAREMKDGQEARRDHSRMLREREAMREEAAARVAEFGGNPHSRDDVNRWLFWKEQGGQCLYTGRTIPTAELFRGGEWDVDHILPRWRSLDDSMNNKALVHRSANAEKGDRTPAEWLGAESEAYAQLLRRAAIANGQGLLPYPKYQRLKTREMETDSFASRQLNDTRYMTRAVVRYLSLLFPPELRVGEKAIQSCRGGLTAELRRQWGLNGLLGPLCNADGSPVLSALVDNDGNPLKSRADHRHHAIDAIVIALSARGLLKRYQDYWRMRSGWKEPQRPEFPHPWATFRRDVQEVAERVTVSHRAQRKIAGAFHEETFYGPARDRNGLPMVNRYVTRKPLSVLTANMIGQIRDGAVRAIIENRLRERGWSGNGKDLPKEWHTPHPSMPSGVPIKKVRVEVTIKNAARLKHRYAELGNNHHIEIIASKQRDNEGTPKQLWASVVPTLEVAERVRRRKLPMISRDHGEDRELLLSLARKESVLAVNPVTKEKTLCIVQMLSGSRDPSFRFDLTLRDARDSRPATEGNKTPFKRIRSFAPWVEIKVTKVQIDPLGRMSAAGD
ncbi:MAG: type II CRISPR RNA-guided endonuclease Cas9 [Candidatus Krumholzibacteriia bacterium]